MLCVPASAAAQPAPRPALAAFTGALASPVPGNLYGVSALSARNAWAVRFTSASQKSLIAHWNGTAWSRVPSPDPGATLDGLDGVAARTSADAWAVGIYAAPGGAAESLMLHWNGRSWSVR